MGRRYGTRKEKRQSAREKDTHARTVPEREEDGVLRPRVERKRDRERASER